MPTGSVMERRALTARGLGMQDELDLLRAHHQRRELAQAARTTRSIPLSLVYRLGSLLLDYDFEWGGLASGVAGLIVAVTLLLPHESCAQGIFAEVCTLASETTWGALMLAGSAISIAGIVCDTAGLRGPVGRLPWGWKTVRWPATFLGFMTWLFMTVLFAEVNPYAPSVPLALVMACLSAFATLRLSIRERRFATRPSPEGGR